MIVKVQWPLAGERNIIIYNRDRTVCELFPATKHWRKTLRGQLKAYFHAHIGDNNRLYIDERAEDQDW